MSLCIGKPVFVAVKVINTTGPSMSVNQMISLSCTPHFELPLGLDHMEIGHCNNNHYEVILNHYHVFHHSLVMSQAQSIYVVDSINVS